MFFHTPLWCLEVICRGQSKHPVRSRELRVGRQPASALSHESDLPFSLSPCHYQLTCCLFLLPFLNLLVQKGASAPIFSISTGGVGCYPVWDVPEVLFLLRQTCKDLPAWKDLSLPGAPQRIPVPLARPPTVVGGADLRPRLPAFTASSG